MLKLDHGGLKVVCVAGIVLINTAGSADTDYDPESPPAPGKPRSKTFVNATSWLTFQYLQRGIANQLRKLYPTRPHNADKFLNDEIYRASCDPCALQVRSHQCVHTFPCCCRVAAS